MTRLSHLLGLRDISQEAITAILDTAAELRERVRRGERLLPLLRGRTIGLVFMEPSTRTRFSFEMAAKRLCAETFALEATASSTVKGETLLDTIRTLRAVGIDLFVLRHKRSGAPHLLARELGTPIVNAGDGIDEHPTQALLDAFTLRDRLGSLEGRTVAIVGDLRHSRVARSNCFGLTRLGARVILVGPGTLCPDDLVALGVEVERDLDKVLGQVDAVMMLRIQRERLGRAMLPSDREFAAFYGLDARRLALAGPDCLVLHPAPMNRGVEISDEVADGHRSVVFEQMANGTFVRMAVMLQLLGEG